MAEEIWMRWMTARALKLTCWLLLHGLLLHGLLHAAKMLVDWAIEKAEERIKAKGEEKG